MLQRPLLSPSVPSAPSGQLLMASVPLGGPATPRAQSLGVLCVGVRMASLGKQCALKRLGRLSLGGFLGPMSLSPVQSLR